MPTCKNSVPTGAPEIVQLYAVSSRSLLVIWQAPEEKDRNGVLTNYIIKWHPVNKQDTSKVTAGSSEESNDYENADVDDDDYDDTDYNDSDNSNSEKKLNDQQNPIQGLQQMKKAADNTSALIEHLNPYTIYEVTLIAGTEKGYGPESEPQRNRTFGDG